MDRLAEMLIVEHDESLNKIQRKLKFLQSVLDMCRQQWTAFDWTSIVMGLVIMFISSALCVMMISSPQNNSSTKNKKIVNILSTIILVSLCISFTSNSYVNAGAETTGFVLATMVCVIGMDISKQRVHYEMLMILVLIRLSSEYVSYRRNVDGPLGCNEPVSMLHSVCPVVALWFLFVCFSSQKVSFHIVTSAVSFLIVCVFWFIQSDDEDSYLPTLVFLLCIIGVLKPHGEFILKLLCLLPLTLLSMGPRSPLSVLLLTSTGLGFLCFISKKDTTRPPPPFACALFWCLLGYHGFFTTGHAPEFASLQHSCGFVGMKGFDPVKSPFWVLLNTIFAPCGMALSSPLLSSVLKSDITSSIAFFSTCMSFSAAFTAALHSRHLMVWAIFAPKFVAESCISICVLGALALGRFLRYTSYNISS
jgi:hypothetical protein